MIIVEGPDNTGKTTLINKLVNDLYLVKSPLKFNPVGDKEQVKESVRKYYNDVTRYLRSNSNFDLKKVIWDRVFFSEFVYGPIKRQGVFINPRDLLSLPHLIAQKRPLIIYCTLPVEKIIKTLHERDQYINESEVKEIYKLYEEVSKSFEHYSDVIVSYDYTKTSYDMIKEIVEFYLNM